MAAEVDTPDTAERFEQTPFKLQAENIDEANGILRNVFLLGTKSEKGYEYLPEGHETNRANFEQMLVGVDHDYKLGPLTSDVAWAVVRSPYCTPEGTFAKEVHFLQSHAKTPSIIESLKRGLGIFAVSPVTTDCVESPRGKVRKFRAVRCDVVVGGGATTGRRFFEQHAEPDPALEALKAEVADLKSQAFRHEQALAAFELAGRVKADTAATVAAAAAKTDLTKFFND